MKDYPSRKHVAGYDSEKMKCNPKRNLTSSGLTQTSVALKHCKGFQLLVIYICTNKTGCM